MSRYFKGWPLGLLGALFSYYYLSMDLLVFSEIFHFIYIEDRYAISILLFRSQLRISANIEFRFFLLSSFSFFITEKLLKGSSFGSNYVKFG